MGVDNKQVKIIIYIGTVLMKQKEIANTQKECSFWNLKVI